MNDFTFVYFIAKYNQLQFVKVQRIENYTVLQ